MAFRLEKFTLFALVCLIAVCAAKDAAKSSCNSCLLSAAQLSEILTAATANGSALAPLQQHICGAQPSNDQRRCREDLPKGITRLVTKLQTAPQVCADLGLCSHEQAITAAASSIASAKCPLCEYLVIVVKERVGKSAEEAEFVQAAEEACEGLPGEARQTCREFVDKYSKHVFALVHEAPPQEVCEFVGMCDRTAQLPRLPEGVRQALSAVSAAPNDDQCDTCQLVIVEARSMLTDPETQKEILDYVKQSCEDFEAFKDQCEAYVDLYGPTVIAQAMQYLKPDLCSQLGFCTANEWVATA